MRRQAWALYARLQRLSDMRIVNDTTWAIEEVLDEILDRISGDREMPSERQLTTLLGNRRRKSRERRGLLARNSTPQVPDYGAAVEARRIEIDGSAALAKLSNRDREILTARGRGESYHAIAARMNCPVGSIKTWAHRARLKVAS